MLKCISRVSLINYTLHHFIIKNNGDCHKVEQLFHYKIHQAFYYNMRALFRKATVARKCNDFNTKCDRYYKLRRLFQNMLAQLQSYYLISLKNILTHIGLFTMRPIN